MSAVIVTTNKPPDRLPPRSFTDIKSPQSKFNGNFATRSPVSSFVVVMNWKYNSKAILFEADDAKAGAAISTPDERSAGGDDLGRNEIDRLEHSQKLLADFRSALDLFIRAVGSTILVTLMWFCWPILRPAFNLNWDLFSETKDWRGAAIALIRMVKWEKFVGKRAFLKLLSTGSTGGIAAWMIFAPNQLAGWLVALTRQLVL